MPGRPRFAGRRLAAALLFGLAALAGPCASAGTLEDVAASRSLRVCIWPDYYAISLRNSKTGQLEGIDVDMARALGAELGAQVGFVDSSFATLIDDVIGRRCQVAMFGIAVTAERAAKLAFTKPHLRSGILAITTKNHPTIKTWQDIDQPGRVVAVQAGTYMEPVMRDALKAAELMSVQRPRTREQEVQSGRADVFMTDFPYAKRLIETADWARLIEPATPYHPIGYAYASSPDDAAWLAYLDGFVAKVKREGRLRAAAERHGLLSIVVTD